MGGGFIQLLTELTKFIQRELLSQYLFSCLSCEDAVKCGLLYVFTLGRRSISVEVQVRDNNVDQALRALKKKMQREGVYREMKLRRHFEKPSEKRVREESEAGRRYRKLMRKRMEREGY